MNRRDMLTKAVALVATVASEGAVPSAVFARQAKARALQRTLNGNWYEQSFYLLHLDHHTSARDEVGRDADPQETRRLIRLARPDVIQIHAKGNPGWTTYPSKAGHTPPQLKRDVMQVWREIARQDGYRFSAYYNLGRDAEIMKRRPQWNRVKADGMPYDRSLCYHSGVAEGYLFPMIDEIIARYQPEGFWFDGSVFRISVCYCEVCARRFRGETNLKDLPKSPSEAGWAEFKEMQRQIYREFVRETSLRIKRAKPDCLVAINWAYSLHMPEAATDNVDYLTGDTANDVDKLSREAHFYDGQQKPFDLMTTIYVNEGAGRNVPKPAAQIEQEMAIIVGNGGRYFAWDNPTRESGLVAERYEYMKRVVAPFLRARQAWCQGTTRVPVVSLLHSTAAHEAATREQDMCFVPVDSRIDTTTEALRRAHLDYEMLTDQRLEQGDVRSGLLLIEDPSALTAATTQAVRRYVEGGGSVLVTGTGFTHHKLPDLFGLTSGSPSAELEDWAVSLDDEKLRLRETVRRATPVTSTRVLVSGIDRKGEEFPLLTRRAVGKGQALCCLFPLFTPRQGRDVPPALVAEIMNITVPAAVRPLTTDAPPATDFVLRRRETDYVLHMINRHAGKRERVSDNNINRVRITDIAPAPRCRVSVRLPRRPRGVQLEPGGEKMSGWAYKGGRLEMDVPAFDIHQMLVIRLGR